MQVSVETLSGIKRAINVTVPAQEVDKTVAERYKRLGKQAKMHGYRQGKVPMARLKQVYGESVNQEAASELIQKFYQQALQEHDLHPCGYPHVHPEPLKPSEDFSFKAEFEVYPEVTLGAVDQYQIEQPQSSVTEADIDSMLEKVKQQHQTLALVDRAAKDGDTLTIDYAGTIDGESFAGGSAEKTALELGSKRFIDGFESGLVGCTAGEEKTLSLQFPEDYHQKDYAGKKVEFKVKVHDVKESVLPEVEELIEKLNIKEGGEAALREKLQQHMQRELRQAIRTAVKSQVMDALTDQHQVELPEALLEQEIKHLKEQMKQRLMQQFGQKDLKGFPEFPDEHFKDEAERRVKLGLVVSELIKANDIKATDEAVTAYLAEMAEPYEDAEKMISWYRGDREKMSEINAVVTEQAVVDWVLAQAQVKETAMPYFEAIEWQPKSDDETNEKEDKA